MTGRCVLDAHVGLDHQILDAGGYVGLPSVNICKFISYKHKAFKEFMFEQTGRVPTKGDKHFAEVCWKCQDSQKDTED